MYGSFDAAPGYTTFCDTLTHNPADDPDGTPGSDGTLGSPGTDPPPGTLGSPGSPPDNADVNADTPGTPLGTDGTPGADGTPGRLDSPGTDGSPGSPGTDGRLDAPGRLGVDANAGTAAAAAPTPITATPAPTSRRIRRREPPTRFPIARQTSPSTRPLPRGSDSPTPSPATIRTANPPAYRHNGPKHHPHTGQPVHPQPQSPRTPRDEPAAHGTQNNQQTPSVPGITSKPAPSTAIAARSAEPASLTEAGIEKILAVLRSPRVANCSPAQPYGTCSARAPTWRR